MCPLVFASHDHLSTEVWPGDDVSERRQDILTRHPFKIVSPSQSARRVRVWNNLTWSSIFLYRKKGSSRFRKTLKQMSLFKCLRLWSRRAGQSIRVSSPTSTCVTRCPSRTASFLRESELWFPMLLGASCWNEFPAHTLGSTAV